MRKILSLIAFLLAMCCSLTVLGQTTNQGTIVGTVKDQNGGVIPSAALTIKNVETNVTRNVTTDGNGNYRVDFLVPGVYHLVVEKSGFKKVELTQVKISVSEITRVDVLLEVGLETAEVLIDVEGSAAINTETATIGEVITSSTIENMPLNGREFTELTGLVPGVTTGSGKTGSVESKGVAAAIDGSRSSYNSYYVDGADSTDNYFGQLVSSPALDAIKEFRVETSLYSAKYGRAGGGVISVVTKSGTNRFNGSAYEFYRGQTFDALPYFYTGPKEDRPVYVQNQYGGTFGGPIFKDRTFFLL